MGFVAQSGTAGGCARILSEVQLTPEVDTHSRDFRRVVEKRESDEGSTSKGGAERERAQSGHVFR